ncbi:MAG: hypothetical protein RL095_705 [Verrucomicrobiota bacterium]|jgi:hypothetical protein
MPKLKPLIIPKQVGAPAYMAQFTILYLLLMVFFIVLTTMAPFPKADGPGKYAGDGEGEKSQKNRIGVVIGKGVFKFGQHGKARYYASYSNAEEMQEYDTLPPMLPEENTKGGGGGGNTEMKTEISLSSTELILASSGRFKPGSDEMDAELEAWFKNFCQLIRSIDEHVIVLCHCNENQDIGKDYALASARAEKLLQFAHDKGHLEFWRLTVGVSVGSADAAGKPLPEQSTEVYMRNPAKAKAKPKAP